MKSEAYRLQISPKKVQIEAGDDKGFFYGLQTLAQIIMLHPAQAGFYQLPCCCIDDQPSFSVRGMMLDISRCKVPTMESLKRLIERLAQLKLNQFQLYMEHTFAYEGHESVWREASPLTAAEIRELDDYCGERFIELVPNQNSCGHMHRWLIHEPYRQMAEVPAGVIHPFFVEPEPFSLCPTDPRVLPFLADLYDQLLPNFRSKQLNVGMDETFDLGMGRSAEACAAQGRDEVYVTFLRQVHELARERGHRIQFWGDILIERTDLIASVPSDAIALEWGYEANHPFAEHAAAFAQAGHDFFVCPGTSSWNSLGGRWSNALQNLALAAREGQRNGASGYLITDWGDFGHWHPEPISYPGLLAGACFAWNAQTANHPEDLPLAPMLSHFLGETNGGLARALQLLGALYEQCGALPPNGSALFFVLLFFRESPEHIKLKGLSPAALTEIPKRIDEVHRALAASDASGPEAEQIRAELAWVADMLAFAADFAQVWLMFGQQNYPPARVEALLTRWHALEAPFKRNWLARNRPGGLSESLAYRTRLEAFLRERIDKPSGS